jgi:acyl-coenzyme A synthetase/AMP-(fatty) acid ligase
MNTYSIDTVLASLQQILELADLQERVAHYPLSSLTALHIRAANISRTDLLRIKTTLCANIVMFYGSAEAGVVALAPYDMIADVPGAVGHVMPGVEVEIVDAANRVLPVGKEGFVRVRSAVLALNVAAAQSPNQWFYPGDLGSMTDNGILCIAAQTSTATDRDAESPSIGPIEHFLANCPGVKEAGVCTLAMATGCSEVWVGLVLHPAADMAMLRRALESDARYKSINKIFVVEGIPRDATGEILRSELLEMLRDIAEEHGRMGDA